MKMVILLKLVLLAGIWLFPCPGEADEHFMNYLFGGSTVVAFGDSITYGFGASPEESYPSVLSGLIGIDVINEGILGETISEGLERLPAVVEKYSPQLVLLCEGGNDMLHGRGEKEVEKDLRKMVSFLTERNIDVVIIGIPSLNLLASVPKFYEKVASDLDVAYEGKIMKKVLSNASFKSDYIHPNAEGYRMIAERIASVIDKHRL